MARSRGMVVVVALGLCAGCRMTNPDFELGREGDLGADDSGASGNGGEDSSGEESAGTGSSDSAATGESSTSESSTSEETPPDTGGEEMSRDEGTSEGALIACEMGPPGIPPELSELSFLETPGAPSFALDSSGCQTLVICAGFQDVCTGETPYLVRQVSGEPPVYGFLDGYVESLWLHVEVSAFRGCQQSSVSFEEGEFISLEIVDGGGVTDFMDVAMPCVTAPSMDAWIAKDGSTYDDDDLLDPAAVWF